MNNRESREHTTKQFADAFDQSDIKYTCRAVVRDFVEITITEDQITSSKASLHRINNWVCDEVHKRWQEKTRPE